MTSLGCADKAACFWNCASELSHASAQVADLGAAAEAAGARRAAAEREAARALQGARAEAASAQAEAEVLRAAAGAGKDEALAALKVRPCPLQLLGGPAGSCYEQQSLGSVRCQGPHLVEECCSLCGRDRG